MKLPALLLFSIFSLFLMTACEEEDLYIGKWVSTHENDDRYIVFDAEGYCIMYMDGKARGGKRFEQGGKWWSMTYDIDKNTTPHQLTMNAVTMDSTDSRMVLGITELVGADTLKIVISMNKTFPTEFNERTFYMTREVQK